MFLSSKYKNEDFNLCNACIHDLLCVCVILAVSDLQTDLKSFKIVL